MENFTLIEGNIPVILHVPYSSALIPDSVRSGILCGDRELKVEMEGITNEWMDKLAESVPMESSIKPWIFINNLSSYVVDVKRFDSTSAVLPPFNEHHAHRSVLTHGIRGQAIREPDEQRDTDLVKAYYYPYEDAFTHVLDKMIAKHGKATILDLISYDPRVKATYQLYDYIENYPDMFVNDTYFHSPASLTSLTHQLIEESGYSSMTPSILSAPWLSGYVPTAYYLREDTVSSLSVTINRDLFLNDEDGTLNEAEYKLLVTFFKELVFRIGV